MNIKEAAIIKSIKTGQTTLLQAIAATVQKLTLMQKAAISGLSGVHLSGNNYLLDSINAIAGFSDITTYTETDPNAHLSATATVATAAALAGSETAYFRKDKGVADITDFRFDFSFNITADNDGTGGCELVSISDTATNNNGSVGENKSEVGYSPDGNKITLRLNVAATDVGYAITLNTVYYATLKRIGSSVHLDLYSNSARTTFVWSATIGTQATAYRYVTLFYSYNNSTYTLSGNVSNPDFVESKPLTGTALSTAIAKDANIGLRYWGDIIAKLAAGAAGSTIAAKICDSAGTPLHSNFVTIPASEYARIPLERPVVLTATSNSQTVWDFTALSNADAFINELGVLAKALIVELALDGTNYTVLNEVTDFAEDISNILAPRITLVSGTGVVSGTSKLRVTYIVNIPLSNTTIKLQIQLNRLASGDASPSIQPLVGDATKYVGAGQVAIV